MGTIQAGFAGAVMRGGRGRVLASGVLSAALIIALGAAAAPAAGPHSHSGGVTNYEFGLNAVSALSSSDAWAVGDGATVLHWNGTTWTRVTAPDPPGGNNGSTVLLGVSAAGPGNIWAVGHYFYNQPGGAGPPHTMILHWDGTRWVRS